MKRELSEDEKRLINGIDIVELVGKFVDLTKSGAGYKGFSPFKSENTPSFTVHPEKKIFKDFSTNIGGNLIYFYSLMKNISYREAMNELALTYGIKLTNRYQESKSIKYMLQYSILNDTLEYFKKNILDSEKALNYMQKRGYSLENIKKYEIGYAKDEWQGLFDYLKDKYDVEELLKLGLISKSSTDENRYFDIFRDRIIFPIYNLNQQIIGFGARYIGDEDGVPKYLNSVESVIFDKSNEVYGIFDRGSSIKEKKHILLTEGYLDVLKSHINGFDNTVATLGTSLTDRQAKKLRNLSNNIIILYDNDEAGKNATKRAINILNKLEFNIKCASLPEGIKDPDEYFEKYTSKDFRELLKTSIDALDYVYTVESLDLNIDNINSKLELINRMSKYFSNISNNIVYDSEIEKFSSKINVNKEEILKEYRYYRNKKVTPNVDTIVKISKEDSRRKIEKLTLEYLIYGKKINESYRNILKNMEFNDDIYGSINKKLYSINYDEKRLSELVFTKEEEDIFIIAFEYNNNISDFNALSLLKTWFNLYLKELNFDNDLNSRRSLKKLQLDINQMVKVEDVMECYNKILRLKGEDSYGY